MADGEETVPVEPASDPVKKSALADLFAGFGDLKPTAGVAPAQALAQITPEEAGSDPDDEDEDGEEEEDEDEEPGEGEDGEEDEDEEEEEEPALADLLDDVMKGLKAERKAIRQLGGLDEPLRARLMSVLTILAGAFDTLANEAAAAEEMGPEEPMQQAAAQLPVGFNAVGVQSALLGAVSLPPFLLKNEAAWKRYLAACPSQDRKILTEMVDKIPTLVMQAVEHIAQVTGVAPQQAIEAAGIPFAALQEEVDRQQAAPEHRPQPSSKRGRKGRNR